MAHDVRHKADENSLQNSIILGFESSQWQSKDTFVYYVLNQLIGQASPFSSGGPGKGMYARAITRFMHRHSMIE